MLNSEKRRIGTQRERLAALITLKAVCKNFVNSDRTKIKSSDMAKVQSSLVLAVDKFYGVPHQMGSNTVQTIVEINCHRYDGHNDFPQWGRNNINEILFSAQFLCEHNTYKQSYSGFKGHALRILSTIGKIEEFLAKNPLAEN